MNKKKEILGLVFIFIGISMTPLGMGLAWFLSTTSVWGGLLILFGIGIFPLLVFIGCKISNEEIWPFFAKSEA